MIIFHFVKLHVLILVGKFQFYFIGKYNFYFNRRSSFLNSFHSKKLREECDLLLSKRQQIPKFRLSAEEETRFVSQFFLDRNLIAEFLELDAGIFKSRMNEKRPYLSVRRLILRLKAIDNKMIFQSIRESQPTKFIKNGIFTSFNKEYYFVNFKGQHLLVICDDLVALNEACIKFHIHLPQLTEEDEEKRSLFRFFLRLEDLPFTIGAVRLGMKFLDFQRRH